MISLSGSSLNSSPTAAHAIEPSQKKFGYTVSALDVEQIQNETDFLSLVRDTLTTDKK